MPVSEMNEMDFVAPAEGEHMEEYNTSVDLESEAEEITPLDGDLDVETVEEDSSELLDELNQEDVQLSKEEASIVPKAEMRFIKQEKTDKPYWYVVYTYSGYENKVMNNLAKTVENLGLHEVILDIKVPMEETIEVKNGKKKHVQKKLYPGYVMVKMLLTDESWYVVRNTRGVTGFVGPGSKPIPLSDAEVRAMGVENIPIKLDVNVGESITITSGPFESFIGVVEEVSVEKQKVKVLVSMFGRDTSVELDFVQVKRI